MINGDVEIDDVAVDERPGIGDAVTDDFVDGSATGLRESVVVKGRGVAVSLHTGLVDDPVDLVRRNAHADRCSALVQHLSGGDILRVVVGSLFRRASWTLGGNF